jgi:hypothetical protein
MLNTLWSDDAQLQVMIAVGRPDDQTFTLDDATLGQLDGIGTLGSPDSPWLDVTCDVRAASWQSGATRTDGVLTRWEAGSCAITFDNNAAQFDITAPNTRFLPMVAVRIRYKLTADTDWTPAWYGYADSWTIAWSDDDDETVTLAATDGTKLLSAYDAPELTTPVGDGETAAQRVQRILAEAEWTQGTRITAGGRTMQSTTMAQDSWTQLLLNQDAELGATYIAMDGALVFWPRDLWLDQTTGSDVVATWGPSDLRYEHAQLVNDDDNFRNIVDAAMNGGTEISMRDVLSVQNFLPHRYGRNDLPLKVQADVQDWCSIVLQTSNSLVPRVDSLEVVPQVVPDELFPVVFSTHYADRWRVTVDPPGKPTATTRPVQVRGWKHDVTPEQWRVTYALSDALLFQPFQLDSTDPDARLDVMRLI